MSTSSLFKKHFGDVAAVNLKHPNIENFFEDLNKECLEEDANTPYKGKTLKEHLSGESTCCCDTGCICNIHDQYIKEQS